jgi:hypothetical protein
MAVFQVMGELEMKNSKQLISNNFYIYKFLFFFGLILCFLATHLFILPVKLRCPTTYHSSKLPLSLAWWYMSVITETGGLQVQSQPHSETLFQKKRKEKKTILFNSPSASSSNVVWIPVIQILKFSGHFHRGCTF